MGTPAMDRKHSTWRARAARVVVMVVLVAVAAACASSGLPPSSSPTTPTIPAAAPTASTASTTAPVVPTTGAPPPPTQASPAGDAAATLATLAVKGRAPKTGYSRSQFGPAWADVDHNHCDTRNDILARDLTDIVRRADGCTVQSGVLADPYTGKTIQFVRGTTTSTAVEIDHVVALSDAWQKGAQSWDAATRLAYANDPLVLLAVDGPTNEAKGDGDAATWLPPNKAFRCDYVARQIAIKAKYQLWVTQAEHDAMAAILESCPGQPLPGG